MEDQQEIVNVPTGSLSTCVRFTPSEYRELQKQSLISGKSIPWLLKTAFFNHGISPPTLDLETRNMVRREIAYIGKNLNQAVRYLHSGLIAEFKSRFEEVEEGVRVLRSYLGLGYGNRKNTV
jgi:hypothetical protein